MQIIFMSEQEPELYANKAGTGKYPDAPTKCPFKDCGINLTMNKNGFYRRYLITNTYTGTIRIRRYKCPKCKRTVSMLPSFCLAGYTYSIEFIIMLLLQVIRSGSIKRTVAEWQTKARGVSHRLIGKYFNRLRNNRKLIQYGINQISPGNINIGRIPGDTEWTKSFLNGIRPNLSPEFNADFHKTTGKSFMSLNNTVA